jgi:hypothetical protein
MLGFVLWAAVRLAASAPEPTIWRLDRLDEIGGVTPEVVGAPRVERDATGGFLVFDGQKDGLYVPLNPLRDLDQFTIEICFRAEPDGPPEPRFLHVQDEANNRALIELRIADGTFAVDTYLGSTTRKSRLPLLDLSLRHPTRRWTWVALVFDRGRMEHFVNGQRELGGTVDFRSTAAGRVSLGMRGNQVHRFKGAIREVRWHRSALVPASLQRAKPDAP